MSVTFFCPDVPQENYVPYPEQDPGFVMTRPVAPFFDINMANSNALDFMEMLGIDPDYCGSWKPEQLPRLLAAATMLRFTESGTALVEPTVTEQGAGGMTMVHCGRDLSYVHGRLDQFILLMALAIKHNKEICWG